MPTSGTTGPPKYIPLRRGNLERALETSQAHYMAGPQSGKPRGAGVQIVAVPSTNMSGLWSLITALSGGGRVLLQDKFEPRQWSETVAEFKPKSVSLPPAALRMILDADIDPDRLASLVAVWAGAAPVGTDLALEFENKYDCPVLITYGATEFAGAITGWSLADWNEWKHTKRGSVGRLHPGVEIGVLDPQSSRVLEPGEMGLLQVRSAQVLGDSGQWFRTNDLGRIDEDGFVWIHGRSDDVINRGGFKIFPSEVEDCLQSHTSVREAVVFGVDDRRLGEVPVAVVVTRDNAEPDDLIAFAKTRLAPYKVPVSVRVIDEIPRNAAMKVLRGELRSQWE
jgi:acyl-coenzyme A synthetase/AMP-(fatty) acid ligase